MVLLISFRRPTVRTTRSLFPLHLFFPPETPPLSAGRGFHKGNRRQILIEYGSRNYARVVFGVPLFFVMPTSFPLFFCFCFVTQLCCSFPNCASVGVAVAPPFLCPSFQTPSTFFPPRVLPSFPLRFQRLLRSGTI